MAQFHVHPDDYERLSWALHHGDRYDIVAAAARLFDHVTVTDDHPARHVRPDDLNVARRSVAYHDSVHKPHVGPDGDTIQSLRWLIEHADADFAAATGDAVGDSDRQ